ncbi:hypothetical protein BV98_002316 [Sphingobium herbicidovorans NBRC 16415]|jgi:hypothetical protein|uniref:Lipoprotein n=1 Tax=Sphingobium herbicidovorans (strain ATCC 700291 / DSM 11019 / CCUG 56400 / KCTC 2939 / LMG 18315 / NBRC 16415 / MH) TaxID=1219045 RepID=A0A086P933_SPHHM|nr:hypothetical protein [Sphingobium herbicidovorans]KFG89901.1 hypothetical protein BV98_002316 [Sphingobium herbicidovorans NBRC 16415]
MRKCIFLAPLILAACAGGNEPSRLTEKEAARLEAALEGKVAGEPVSCVNRYPQASLTAINESVLLYRVSGRLVYRNDLIGSCTGLGRGDTLVIRPTGSQYCRGDIARSADLVTGSITGGCALGSFTPYRSPDQ